jgi:5-methylcytosine-specific restriction endonuclease McrA
MSAEYDCYRLIQEVVVRETPFCRRCGSPATVGHHLFKRDRLATAFLPEAVWSLCNDCHGWAHRNPYPFQLMVVNEIGERYYELLRLSHTVVKNMDFKNVKEELKKRLREIPQP